MKPQRWSPAIASVLLFYVGCADGPAELTEPPEVSFSQQGGVALVVGHGEELRNGRKFSITARTAANGVTTGSFSFLGIDVSVDCLRISGGKSALVSGQEVNTGGQVVWAITSEPFNVWNGLVATGDCDAPGGAVSLTPATGQITIRG